MTTLSFSTGTPITWKAASGTYAITLASLAAGAARQGAKGDLGATRAIRWAVRLAVNFDVAPVNGTTVDLYWSSSNNATAGTDNTGAASGADAAYTGSAGGALAGTKLQLQYIGSLIATADADGVVQVQEFTFYPLERWGMPIVVNSTGQAFEGDDDSHCISLIPLPEAAA